MKFEGWSLEEKFWPKVNKSDGCWNWNGFIYRNGYGQASHRNKKILAHRASWMVNNGPIPKGMFVLHHCDNPSCVNPDHLFLGTHQDNMRDQKAKGRHFSPFTAKKKLTDDSIRKIRTSFVRGTGKKLAAEYGVTEFTIYRVVRGVLGRTVV